MKLNPIRLLFSAIFLLIPAVLWNTVFLDYIDQHGKVIPWVLTIPVAFLSTGIFQGFHDAIKPFKLKGTFNPFWGWFAVALAIEIFITAASNT